MSSAIDWSRRPTYSQEQLGRYFDRIGLPEKYRKSPVIQAGATIDGEAALDFLRVLQRYQVAAVPFENLSLHYAAHRGISIDPDSLFEKIVDSPSERGGYCMENSGLFGTVLRSLGYEVTAVGGRVNEAAQPMSASKNWKGPKYDGWYDLLLPVLFFITCQSVHGIYAVGSSWSRLLTSRITGTTWSISLPSASKSTSSTLDLARMDHISPCRWSMPTRSIM